VTEEKRLSLVGHLDELRGRAIFCFVASFVGMIVAYCLYNPWLLNLLKAPLDALSGNPDNPFVFDNPLLNVLKASSEDIGKLKLELHFIGPMEVFMVKLKTSFFGGVVLASPVIAYQVWKFVSVGLTDKERKSVVVCLPVSFVLFLLGLLIAYVVMLPVVLYFLVVVSGRGLVPTLILSKYVSLVVVCCLAFALIFEMPLVVYFLTRLGIVSPSFLARKRKYSILLMFILAAMLTPPDIITQVMMALPMIILYEASIWVSRVAWRRRQKSLE
jgi:sec-independent protein translocase protein TatC